jgi:nucleoside-diphosphate-sugar epimerase
MVSHGGSNCQVFRDPQSHRAPGAVCREFLYAADAAESIVPTIEYYNGAELVNIGAGLEIRIRNLGAKVVYRIQ